jgi:hypothetical protein
MLRRGVAAVSLAAIGTHAIYIEATKLQHRNSIRKQSVSQSTQAFLEDVTNNVATGDIILFARKWYHHHIPMALSLAIYHSLHDSDYDHVGIIIHDDKGIPQVFEMTPYGGCSLKPINERVLYSRSHQIALIAVLPRREYTKAERQQILSKVKAIKATSECRSMLPGSFACIVEKWLGVDVSFLSSTPHCPSTRLALDGLHLVGANFIKLGYSDNSVDCADILDRSITDVHGEHILDENTTLLRMR